MAQTITLSLTPKQAADSKFYTSAVAKQLGVKQSDIALLRIVKRSVDARRGGLKVNLTLEAFLDFEPMPEPCLASPPYAVTARFFSRTVRKRTWATRPKPPL